MDATLVRVALVPAFMRLAGEANWWAPKWMRGIYDRFGFNESDPEELAELEIISTLPDQEVDDPPASPMVSADLDPEASARESVPATR